MSELRIADELRLDAPIDAVWHAIEDPAAHARWHPFVNDARSGRDRHSSIPYVQPIRTSAESSRYSASSAVKSRSASPRSSRRRTPRPP